MLKQRLVVVVWEQLRPESQICMPSNSHTFILERERERDKLCLLIVHMKTDPKPDVVLLATHCPFT